MGLEWIAVGTESIIAATTQNGTANGITDVSLSSNGNLLAVGLLNGVHMFWWDGQHKEWNPLGDPLWNPMAESAITTVSSVSIVETDTQYGVAVGGTVGSSNSTGTAPAPMVEYYRYPSKKCRDCQWEWQVSLTATHSDDGDDDFLEGFAPNLALAPGVVAVGPPVTTSSSSSRSTTTTAGQVYIYTQANR